MTCARWHGGMVWAKVLQNDHGFAEALIDNVNSLLRGIFAHEVFIGTGLPKPEHRSRLGIIDSKFAVALDDNAAVGHGILDCC